MELELTGLLELLTGLLELLGVWELLLSVLELLPAAWPELLAGWELLFPVLELLLVWLELLGELLSGRELLLSCEEGSSGSSLSAGSDSASLFHWISAEE